MKRSFNFYIQQILEDLNVYPQHQIAINTGPDAGITFGDTVNTFPSKLEQRKIVLPKKKKKKKK